MKIAIIGCGGLGTALARGLLQSKEKDLRVRICDPNRSKIDLVAKDFLDRDIALSASPRETAQGAEVVILAVKPKDVREALTHVREVVDSDALLVSCVAGVTVAALEKVAGMKVAIARVMPNTAVCVAAGTTGVFLGPKCNLQRDSARLERIFSLLGDVRTVPDEDDLHAVTALSGSGPAFVLLMLEAMMDAGVRSGLSRGDAEFFAKGALSGASALAKNSKLSPSDLRAQITSPAGTTIEGLYHLEKVGLKGAVMDAVDATYCRSLQMGAIEQLE